MAPKHVINDFEAWHSGQANQKNRPAIEKHLAECADCRAYFEKMSAFLAHLHPSSLPRLEADPFLPTRIRALSAGDRGAAGTPVKASTVRARKRPFGWAGLAAMGVMLIAAVWVGAYFGERLSTISLASSQYDETDIISSFYDEFSPSGIAGDWETILENNEEESNET